MDTPLEVNGFRLFKGLLDRPAQERLREDVRGIAGAAPFFHPETRWGRKMSVRMTSAGRCGWVSDRRGYRYEPRHPGGGAWPAIPDSVLEVWRKVVDWPEDPSSCLVNFYSEKAKMGLHRDADEGDVAAPVVSISLGDPARFRIGGMERGDPTTSVMLDSGDVVVMGGAARLAYHGVDRILFGRSDLLRDHGRINLTLRWVAAHIANDDQFRR